MPLVVNAGPDISIECAASVDVVGQATGGVGNLSYSWTDGNTILAASPTMVYQTMQPATLTLTATDECGNIASDAANVFILPTPILLTVSPDTAICLGEMVELYGSATGGVGTLDHTWTPSGSHYNTIYVSPGESTTYTYTANDICGNTASANVWVGVELVRPGFTVEYIGETGIELTNHTYNGVSYMWTFDDGTVTYTTNVAHSFDTAPIVVTLTATGSLGCVEEHTEIFYPYAHIYVPNTFTPNGDGINDAFLAKGHDLRSFEMFIFNRWGDVVFHSTDINTPWDGSHRNGDYFSPDGIYNYKIKAIGVRGNVIEKSGFVQIIR